MTVSKRILTVWLFVLIFFFWWFSKEMHRVRASEVSSWKEDHSADCAVVLTGGPQRVREGFDLLIRGAVQKLIISGVNPQTELREMFPQWPYHGELREADVILEKNSQTTYGNAQQTLPLVEAVRCRDLILVTSRLHMYRALSTFQAAIPAQVTIYPRAVLGGDMELSSYELAFETLKSMFYSVWAY